METITPTQELIEWITTLKDKEVLDHLLEMKRKSTFNFDEAFKKAIPLADARQRSIEKIRQYQTK
jgi:hypothetical protein